MPNNNRLFFTNESPSMVNNSSGSYGVINVGSPLHTPNIIDGLVGHGSSLGKLGSSMPSPVARMFLFSAALREVNDTESKNTGIGHEGKLNATGKLETTPYHDLVGEMLDMLEFIFKYGDEYDFHVLTWDLNKECDNLSQTGREEHKRLAEALQSAFSYGPLANFKKVFIFKWKDDVIGGTSPISLVYTSANLHQMIAQKGYQFTGNKGNVLFTESPLPLHQRAESFREYLYRLRLQKGFSASADSPRSALDTYITDSAANYDQDLGDKVNANPGQWDGFKVLTSQGVQVDVDGVLLRVTDQTFDPTTSDYVMAPTTSIYQRGNVQAKVPLALTKEGVAGLVYAAGRPWNDDIPAVLETNPNDRRLPGLNQPHPFVTVNDFLEEKIIEVSYELNGTCFYTGTDAQHPTHFLLPLKQLFFEYFTVDDLVGKHMLAMNEDKDRKRVIVKLQIPLVNGKQITFYRDYDTSDGSSEKVDCYDSQNTFDFAVFPFYRLQNSSDNVYHVMLGTTVDGMEMKFYEPKPVGLSQSYEVASTLTHRTRKGPDSQLSTDHIRVSDAFSYAEISLPQSGGAGVHALVIPLFTRVDADPARAKNHFTFGIDFGTTNTYVAYANEKPPFGNDNIQPFSYTADGDPQMVTFNSKSSGAAEFAAFITAVKREFVPDAIGDSKIKFPMRTATYQAEGSPSSLELFNNTNIGFNYGEDISKSANYKTNIKWDRFDSLALDRIRTFFVQTLWMMKNKAVLNQGSTHFDLVVTYPLSMRPNDYQNFMDAWNQAKGDVKCAVNIRYRTESIAPYYSYLADLQYGEPYINIDIGGGTTDILYVDPINNEALVFSAFFAANDLWNDGIDPACLPAKANGFVSLYKSQRMPKLGDRQSEVQAVIENAKSSADIINYLFTNDRWTHLSDTIRSSPSMMQLPVVHFASVVFYTAYALHMAEVDIPRTLTFTGMGSKYVRLISAADSDIAGIVNAVFHYCGKIFKNTKLQNSSIVVSFNQKNPKEVTANGALMSINYSRPISPVDNTVFGYEEEDPSETLKYQQISSEIEASVIKMFGKFVDLFNDNEFINVLGNLDLDVDKKVTDKLSRYAFPSLRQQKDNSTTGQRPNAPLKEPMFFWPLKNALYVIGKELAK